MISHHESEIVDSLCLNPCNKELKSLNPHDLVKVQSGFQAHFPGSLMIDDSP